MSFDSALYAAAYSSQNMVPQCPDALVNTSVALTSVLKLAANNRKPVRGIIKNNGARDHRNCCSNRTKVLMGVGTIGLWGFESVYDRRPTEMCMAEGPLIAPGSEQENLNFCSHGTLCR